ncbi:MAG: hypothetical protein MJZ58_01750 [Paludibacteraceae bacterium]|nr:hypothetical protein [Paludibacteraceae bacterium]
MKKIFSFVLALVATMALNATTYYFAGNANGWNNRSTAFSGEDGILTVQIAQLDGSFKIVADGGVDEWHPQYGLDKEGGVEGIELKGPKLTLKKAVDGAEEANIKDIKVLGLGDHEAYKDAVIKIDVNNPDEVTCLLIAGTKISTVDAYQIVGAYNDWTLETAAQFEDVSGTLTATIADFNGTFKLVMNRSWDNQWGTNGNGFGLNEDYAMVKDGGNVAFANPFAGYKNATLTLNFDPSGNPILKMTAGEFYVTEDNWYFPGGINDWKINETSIFTPVDGAAKPTFEFLAAEFSGEFKVVYGNWMVEFGANEDKVAYPVNEAVTMQWPAAGNASVEGEYQDVTITIVPNYEVTTVELTISTEATNLHNLSAAKKANKRIENGRIILYQGEARFDVLGNVVK